MSKARVDSKDNLMGKRFIRVATSGNKDATGAFERRKRRSVVTCPRTGGRAKNHMRRGTGRTRTDSAAMTVALSEFMWCKRYEEIVLYIICCLKRICCFNVALMLP